MSAEPDPYDPYEPHDDARDGAPNPASLGPAGPGAAGPGPGSAGEPEDASSLCSPPDGEDAWLAGLPFPVLDWVLDLGRAQVGEAAQAGFTHRGGGTGPGFAAGGVLDAMRPGPDLAGFAEDTWQRGVSGLSDDELCGLICAQRRLASWASAGELAAIAELDARRARPGGRPGEHVQDEIAALQTRTARGADRVLGHARALRQVPGVAAALAAGRIDLPKAEVFADETICLGQIPRAAVCAAVLPRAPGLTTGRLRSALRAEIAALDPQAALRRRKKAEQDARVEAWTEVAGTSALAGRDLPPAGVITADKWIGAQARRLKAAGVAGSLDQVRASVFLAVLSGRGVDCLLPASAPDGGQPRPVRPGGPPGSPALGVPAGLGGSVHLIMPASAWLGLSDRPGEVAGLGAQDAGTCRDLAAALAVRADSRWCVTLTDQHGRAVGHGCARAGPGPPGPGPPGHGDPAGWLHAIKITLLERGSCTHQRQSAGYRPSPSLRHLVKIRDRDCGFPGCRRPAERCDDDHTLAYHKGGKTCSCNLHPMCRRHHRTKQAPDWRLEQPEPGVLVWTLPGGRKATVTAEPYPAG